HCDLRVRTEAYRTRVQAPFNGSGTLDRGNLPKEYDISTAELYEIKKRGGIVGVFLGQNAVDGSAAFLPPLEPGDPSAPRAPGAVPGGAPFANDCAGTSKSFAATLLFGQRRAPYSLAVASDFCMISTVAPRFGQDACGAYIDIGSGSESGAQLLETLMEPD